MNHSASTTDNAAPRRATFERSTNETRVAVSLDLDGIGRSEITTGLPFLDHMLRTLALHARFDLDLRAAGDLDVDDHHTVEDCALAIGHALDQALGDRRGITRFGDAHVPLDEALARAAVDLSGRPWPAVALGLVRPSIGTVATENLTHFLRSLAIAGRMALHVTVLTGENDHHRVEAAFKATARALRLAVQRETIVAPGSNGAPSTKGVL
jgi:imidazoleglycerol-phosphate dehydratase